MKLSIPKISFTISILGIFLLLLLMNLIEPKKTNISDIKLSDINRKVKVQGKVDGIKNYETITIVSISDKTGKIDLIINSKNIHLIKNQNITVTGRLTQYKGKLQVQVEKIN